MGTLILPFAPSGWDAAHKKVQPLGTLMPGDRHDRPRHRGGASRSRNAFLLLTLKITRSASDPFLSLGEISGFCILHLFYLTDVFWCKISPIVIFFIFEVDTFLFVKRF